METIEKVIFGLVLFAATSIIAYLFRMRQLYATMPKLFRHARVSKDGSLCELIVYNKGNQVEEDIKVEIDPELKGELLASSSSDISFEDTILKIERLHKRSEASAILLIENGVLDASKLVSVSSKDTKGKIVKNIYEVPPNTAFAFMLIFGCIMFIPGVIYGIKGYEALKSEYAEYRLKSVYEQGWKNLSAYYESQLKISYGNQEFPLQLIEDQANEKDALVFEAYNKTTVPLNITANKKDSVRGDISSFSAITIPPMSKQKFTVKLPPKDSNLMRPRLTFSFKSGEEFLYEIEYQVRK